MDVHYFLYDHQHPVDDLSPEWRAAIPVHRPGVQSSNLPSITYGDYFTAVGHFLLLANGQGLIHGLSCQLEEPVLPAAIGDISILIQKHGAFYHPARVDVQVGSSATSLVVNVAVSSAGRNVLRNEFDLMLRLNQSISKRFIPRVYHQAEVAAENRPYPIPMFLGEWLNGFHEFHTHMEDTGLPAVHIWHPERQIILNRRQERDLYRQVAEILTYYYNLYTFDQIFPWHHAAGDFVVRMQNQRPAVRLITVRGYAPMVDVEDTVGEKRDTKRTKVDDIDPLTLLEALFRFFIHLSLRTRIDRIDGTGDLIWAGDNALDGTIRGFMDGLAAKDPVDGLAVSDLMALYLSRLSKEDFEVGVYNTINAYPTQSPERQLMKVHQNEHAERMHQRIESILSSLSA